MRAALEGLIPRLAAAVRKAVVLKGVGRLAGRGLLLDLGDRRGLGEVLVGLADPGLFLEAICLVADGERLAVLEVHLQLPVRLGDEGPPLALALGYEGEGRGLHASHGEKRAP
jgi:hypothetical protein